ncbi:D-arabinono-1,4-lactone oxidase [Marinoscillum sp. MHG1-6]|uniref:D-arabinono-1,4-lactone oxidase n=1 Tax=Marinoscillum sp. MHG1-6 TaxID=2959627 RepID=UPI002157B0B6|nr:D-arabinono-1,4-lactone oxidase [Marinoscillum sp. MHG1-6]
MPVYRNWSGSFQFKYQKLHQPTSESEIVAVVRQATNSRQKVKVVGSGHSCSQIAKADDAILISLKNYNRILEADPSSGLVKAQSGIILRDLCKQLKHHGLALQNMGTIDEQTLAGAIATGTHGTGITQPAIDQQIHAYTLVTGTGEVIEVDQNHELYEAGKVALGALGILSTITLKCVANFKLEVNTFSTSLQQAVKKLPEHLQSPYFRLWWFPHTNKVQVWQANETTKPASIESKWAYWYKNILLGNYVTELGLWFTSFLPTSIRSFNRWVFNQLFSQPQSNVRYAYDAFVIPIRTKQLVMEYAIPIGQAESAIKKMEAFIESGSQVVHFPIEIRFAPSNEAWMSMSYERTSCYIGIITYHPYGKKIPHEPYFRQIHHILADFDARPHWAKIHYFSAEALEQKYAKWNDFKRLRSQLDPEGMFENEYLKKLFSTEKKT